MDPLDDLPLELLLALQDAASAKGRERAAKRAADAGFHLELAPGSALPDGSWPPRFDPEPIPMEEADEGVESLWLHFGVRENAGR
jgi:hypothetical protein